MTTLDSDLLEEYERLRKKEFLHDIKGDPTSTEDERRAFLKKKIAAEIAEFQAKGKEKGDEELMKSIQRTQKKQRERGLSPLEVSGITSPM